MCGADATGATHPLKCGARVRAQPDPLFLLSLPLCFSSPTAAAARLPFGPPPNRPRNRQIYPAKSFLLHSSRMVWLLDEEYDREHRAVHMTERGTDLHPLKIRYHGTVDIPYDERYTEFIQPTGLMPFISLVSRGGPNMNPSALTALVDRWRPETHTFHLRAGEMAPTLQDVSMILGLPIQGDPLCMNTASDGWRGQMEDLIGKAPPAPANPKERVPAGASFSWIRTNFAECPEGANEDTRRTYARVYLWYMISRTLFPDSGGKLAHWCWLKALTVLDSRWSWGTAALAYLYRQLDEACRRTGSRTGSGGIGGCLLLLSVWSWDRISVGRPRVLQESHWPHYRNNPDREPTWAYLWDNVSEMTSDPKIMYRQYTAELDTLTAEQVEWEPYGTYYRIGAGMPDLNHKCTEEARFWRMRCPLICMWLVEHHQPQRVMRQFGLYQECPPVWQDTDKALHR
ncbi:serine/threonine-protein phosphatase 7 long form homolog [Lolium perenne]|uniref:serine/threonine-protein phosphatase 7 long form homolog n=1 Tax=Lolium perenne TaxID=4522 RepID=UPI003A99C89D